MYVIYIYIYIYTHTHVYIYVYTYNHKYKHKYTYKYSFVNIIMIITITIAITIIDSIRAEPARDCSWCPWSQKNGVNTNGAAAEVMSLTNWGNTYALALLG